MPCLLDGIFVSTTIASTSFSLPRLGRPGFYEEWFGSDGNRPAQRAARILVREELVRLAKVTDEADKRLIDEALARLQDV